VEIAVQFCKKSKMADKPIIDGTCTSDAGTFPANQFDVMLHYEQEN
jgi:hypothetical protein